MKNKISSIVVLFIIHSNCFAGADNLPMGAKQAGMGNAAVATSDIWSIYHNQAGLAGLEKTTASIYATQGYMLKQMNQGAVAVAYPTKYGVFAASFNSFGFKLYNENKAGLAFARKFGDALRIGAQANLNSISLGDIYGKKSTVTFEAGVQSKLTKKLWLGAHFYNISRSSVTSIEKVPVIVRFGLNYSFNTNVQANIEYEKNWTIKPLYKAGLEYRIVPEFALRAGINGGSSKTTFIGAAYKLKLLSIDAACSFDSRLGTSPHLGLTYLF